MKKTRSLIVLLMVLFLVSCAVGNQQALTAKQQASVWLGVYNAQYDDVYSVMTNPLSTPVQRTMALKKKEILVQLWPLLKTFVATIDGGIAPTSEQVVNITELINQLTAFAIAR